VILATVVMVGLLAGWQGTAWAHAELDSTSPAADSVATNSPDEVVLTFTEGVSVEVDGVRVLDGGANRHETGNAVADGSVVRVPLESALAEGGYVVAWRVVSADGHPIHGAFQFSVGTRTDVDPALADRAFGASGDRRDEVTAAVLRGVAYLAALVVAGSVLVGTWLRTPGEPSPVTHRVGLLAGAGVVALVLQVPIRASLATGRGWGSVTEVGLLGRSLGDGMGWALAVSVLGLVMVGITAGLPFRGAVRTCALVGAGLAPVGFAFTGHTRTMSPAVVGLLADLAHLVAAAVWMGGLASLVGCLARRRAADDVVGAADAVARFSGLAGAALIGVVVTGGAMAAIEVGGIGALTTTTYGRLLMVKVALVALVAALGGWNRLRILPALGVGGSDPSSGDAQSGEANSGAGELDAGGEALPASDPRWSTLGRILRLEVAALVIVVAVTAVLVNVTPARSATPVAVATVEAEAALGQGRVRITVTPARSGANEVHVFVLGADGRLDRTFTEAAVSFSQPALDVGPLEGRVSPAGAGHFVVDGIDLPLAGEWVVKVTVQPDRFSKLEAEIPVRIG